MNSLLLAGQPNSGKTTIFNFLTKSQEKVGNFCGVTVDSTQKNAKINNINFSVKDTPGVYSLSPVTMEEKVSTREINLENGLILFIVETANFFSSLKTLTSLLSQNKKVLLCLNMFKEFIKKGGKIDVEKVKSILKIPVIVGDFCNRKDIKRLKEFIVKNVDFSPLKNLIVNEMDFKDCYKECKLNVSNLDKILLNKFLAIPIFLFVCYSIFYLSFGNYGIGKTISDFFLFFINALKNYVKIIIINSRVSPFIQDFILNAIFDGVFCVFTFIPQILTMTLLINILELSGYLSRLAYIFEGFLSKSGINGRAVFCILMGFGCTVGAIKSTNGLESSSAKKKAILLTCLVPCSAKIPVLVFLSLFAGKFQGVFLFCLFLVAVLIIIVQMFLVNKFIIKTPKEPLIIELPPYRLPNLITIAKSLKKTFKQFIIKISTIIFCISLVVFLLKSVSISFCYTNGNYENSVLYFLGKLLNFIFIPIGINDGKIGITCLMGFIAKEGIITTILNLYPTGLGVNVKTLFSFCVFVYVYTPCITSVYQTYKDTSLKFTIFVAVWQLLLAIICSYVVFLTLNFSVFIIALLIIIIVAGLYDYFHSNKKRKTN